MHNETLNTHAYYRSLSCLGTYTSITFGGIKLVVLAITTPLG